MAKAATVAPVKPTAKAKPTAPAAKPTAAVKKAVTPPAKAKVALVVKPTAKAKVTPAQKTVTKKPVAIPSMFEEVAPAPKPAAKTVKAPVVTPDPVKKKVVKAVVASEPVVPQDPALDEVIEESAVALAKRKELTAKETAIELAWSKVFNAYLKRDIKLITSAVASVTALVTK